MIKSLVSLALMVLCVWTGRADAQSYVHPIDFHIPSGWCGLSDINQRLQRYVNDVNVIYARGTNLRFSLGQIHCRDAPMPTTTRNSTVPLVGAYTFAAFIDANIGSRDHSHGGQSGYQIPEREGKNELSLLDMHWKNIYSDTDLQNSTNRYDYLQYQVLTIVHEIGHHNGLGLSEYYGLGTYDQTGVAPIENLVTSPPSPYWAERMLANRDPMRACAYDECEFSPLSKTIINRVASGYYDTRGCHRGYYFPCTSVGSHTMTVRVVNADGAAISGCAVQAYIAGSARPASPATLRFQGTTDAAGVVAFSSQLAHDSFSNVYLLKAQCPNRGQQSKWISIFDIQAQNQGMPGGGLAGDFRYPGAVVFTMPTLPPQLDARVGLF
ncbi:hypothetical protein F0U60_51275 [Archangium minus]|uniref:Uncharacterized protein n=1 Tax=Archangium minus TaxID=83450 RepID=A0ABY9X882_9BACT|nr:hypothetical protein F0U60_51275 [Archangium minus]